MSQENALTRRSFVAGSAAVAATAAVGANVAPADGAKMTKRGKGDVAATKTVSATLQQEDFSRLSKLSKSNLSRLLPAMADILHRHGARQPRTARRHPPADPRAR